MDLSINQEEKRPQSESQDQSCDDSDSSEMSAAPGKVACFGGKIERRLPSVNFHSIADLIRPSCNQDDKSADDGQRQARTTPSPPSMPRNAAELAVTPPGHGGEEGGHEDAGQPGAGEESAVKKGRTIYKAQQVYVLEQIFQRTHYPDPEVIETLSTDLNIAENKIKVWFQNKRARWRRRVNDNPSATMTTTIATNPILSPPPPPPQTTWANPALLTPPTHHMPPAFQSPPTHISPPVTFIMPPKTLQRNHLENSFMGSRPPVFLEHVHGGMDVRIGHPGLSGSGLEVVQSGQFSQSSLLQLRKAAQLHAQGMGVMPGMPYGTAGMGH